MDLILTTFLMKVETVSSTIIDPVNGELADPLPFSKFRIVVITETNNRRLSAFILGMKRRKEPSELLAASACALRSK
jgi:hypothetical protein